MQKLIIDLIIRFNKDDVPAISSQLAYKLILAFFPFIIFLMTLLGFTSLNKIEVIISLTSILPQSVAALIKNTVLEVANIKSSSLLSISLIFTLWSASSGFNAVIKGLNKAYGVKEKRSFIRVRLISLLCTLGMSLIIIIMVLLLVFGTVIWNAIAHKYFIFKELLPLWIVLKYLIVVVTAIFVFSALYRYAPSRKLKWVEVCPGSIFSTFSLILVSIGFAFYVNNFGRYSVVYGSIGAIIVLLLWLFLVSTIIILGGEVNASLATNNSIRSTNSYNFTKGM